MSARRTLVLWCPDWPVTAAVLGGQGAGPGGPSRRPVAVVDRGQVLAVSPAARAAGVSRGLRVREAQSRCAELVVLRHDPGAEARAFEPVLRAVEAVAPGVQVLRPGTCAVPARGSASYLGGETAAAAVLLDVLEQAGVPDARVGVADGPFSAEQAARTAERLPGYQVVPAGGDRPFLAGLPVDVLAPVLDPDAPDLLRRLGLRTVGAFADLSPGDVLARFGSSGGRAHRLARGDDVAAAGGRAPLPELGRTVELDPPLDRAEQVAATLRPAAEQLVSGLAGQVLVCTGLRVELTDDLGGVVSRRWLHPRFFTAADVLDRVRWQLAGGGLGAPVARVDLLPEDVEPQGAHTEGLWGGGPDDHVHQALTRVQSRLGHRAVGTSVVGGGRGPADRTTFVPWGDRPLPTRPAEPPWPGRLPPPLPSTVLTRPAQATVVGAAGSPAVLDDRGTLSVPPARFRVDDGGRPAAGWPVGWQPVQAWAGPWPADERWWTDDTRGRPTGFLARLQVVGVDGSAWLLLVSAGHWWVEARYD